MGCICGWFFTVPLRKNLYALREKMACIAAGSSPGGSRAAVLGGAGRHGQITSTPAPDLSQDNAMKARLNYNLGYELFEKALQLENSSAGSAAKARAADPEVKKGLAEGARAFSQRGRRRSQHEGGLEPAGLHQSPAWRL